MQYISRFSIRPGKANEYRQWVLKNSGLFKEQAPKGWTYLGTWFTVRDFGKYQVETRWELDDYASLAADFGGPDLQKAYLAAMDMMDPSQGGETYLMKSATDVKVMDGA